MQQQSKLDEKLTDNHTRDPEKVKKVVNKVLAAAEKAKANREVWVAALKKQGLKENVEKWTATATYAKGAWNSKEREEETLEIPVSFHRQHYHPHNYVPSASHFMGQLNAHETHKKMTAKGYHLVSDKSHFKKGE